MKYIILSSLVLALGFSMAGVPAWAGDAGTEATIIARDDGARMAPARSDQDRRLQTQTPERHSPAQMAAPGGELGSTCVSGDGQESCVCDDACIAGPTTCNCIIVED
jgi:hypothetical protein